MKKIISLYFKLAPFIIAASIFYLSSLERLPENIIDFRFGDKVAHFIAYFVFSLHLYVFLKITFLKLNEKFIKYFTVIFAILYGISDEIHQSFVPGRNSGVDDVIADALSACLILLLSKLINNYIISKLD